MYEDRDSSNLIRSAMSGKDVISALAKHGCSDLTSKITLSACSKLPLDGGGFCDVYRGSTNHGVKIAIKCLRLYDRPGCENVKEKVLKRAARELYYWSKLKHPNVLPLMGLAMFRGHLSMISEWMENGNLTAYINLNPEIDRIGLAGLDAETYKCVSVSSGLAYIHAKKMVHGDLKAANVMVSRNGIAMIADFGNSRLKDLTLKFTNTTSSSLSVRWAAPELLSGDNDPQVSKESDVYAYGMTALETLTGKVPYHEYSDLRVMSLVGIDHQIPTRPTAGVSDEIWGILKDCWTSEKSGRPDIRSVERLLRYIYFDAWAETRMRGKLGAGYFQMNEFAMPELELNNVVEPEGPSMDHRKKLRSLSHQAKVYLKQDQLAEAGLLYAEVLAVQKRVLGVDHPDTLRSMHNLVVTYGNQGRLAEAESLGVKVVAARKRVLGADHPDTLWSMHNLALTYQTPSQLAGAEALGAEVVAARKRVLGVDHPDTLDSMHNLAVTYERQGQLAEAESLGAAVMAARKRVLGADHPDTLESMHHLAVAYEEQGQLADAEALGAEVMSSRKRVLGEDHPDSLNSMHTLALTYLHQGRLVEAALLGVKVVASQKRVLGPDHPDTLGSIHNLAITYLREGRLAEAKFLGAEVVAARKRILGAGHPDLLASMHVLTHASMNQNQRTGKEPQELKAQIAAPRGQVVETENPRAPKSVYSLATTYEKQNELEEEESPAAKAVTTQKQVPKGACSTSQNSVHTPTLTRECRLAETELLEGEAVATRKLAMEAGHPSSVADTQALAVERMHECRLAEVHSPGAEVVASQKQALGTDHPNAARSMDSLALTRKKQSRMEGKLLLEVEMATQRQTLGVDYLDVLRLLSHYISNNRLALWVPIGDILVYIALLVVMGSCPK